MFKSMFFCHIDQSNFSTDIKAFEIVCVYRILRTNFKYIVRPNFVLLLSALTGLPNHTIDRKGEKRNAQSEVKRFAIGQNKYFLF